jgi:hypothetical protein
LIPQEGKKRRKKAKTSFQIYSLIHNTFWLLNMGLHEKSQVEGVLENSEKNRKWVINLRKPLKPINTRITLEKSEEEKEINMEEECSTTPRGEGSRIPVTLICPPAPRKRKSSLKWNYRGKTREFFTPPELETVFIRHVERAIAN